MVDEVLLHIAHQTQRKLRREDAGVLRLVFFEDVRLYGTTHLLERVGFDLSVNVCRQYFVAGAAKQEQSQSVVALGQIALVGGAAEAAIFPLGLQYVVHFAFQAVFTDVLLALLVDGRIHEKAQQHRRGPVDGHRYRGHGVCQVKARVEFFGVVQATNAHSCVANLAVDVRAVGRVVSVQSHRVKRGTQTLGGHAQRHVVEALVGALGAAFSGEHTRGILALAFERVYARSVREFTGHVLLQAPVQDVAPAAVARYGHFGDLLLRERLGVGVNVDLLVAHFKGENGVAVTLALGSPSFEQFPVVRVEVALDGVEFVEQGLQSGVLSGVLRVDELIVAAEFLHGLVEPVQLVGHLTLGRGPAVKPAVVLGNLAQVAGALGRDDVDLFAHLFGDLERRGEVCAGTFHHLVDDSAVQRVGARVVELRGNGAVYRQILVCRLPELVVAAVLFLHVTHRIEGPTLVKLVDGHDVRKVQHVDLLELCGGAKFRSHYIERGIAVVQDLGVALANAGGLQDDHVELRGFEDVQCFAHMLAQGQVALACGQRAHIHPFAADAVHADAVAQQCATGATLGGIHRDDGQVLFWEIEQETSHKFIHQRALACAAGARDAQYRRGAGGGLLANAIEDFAVVVGVVLCGRNQARQVFGCFVGEFADLAVEFNTCGKVTRFHQVVDHALQAHFSSVVGVVDAGNAVVV